MESRTLPKKGDYGKPDALKNGAAPNRQDVVKGKQEALRKVSEAMDIVRYGEIVVKMENGKPVWVDALMRERVG